MAYDGSGVFNRLYNWQADAAAGINILADRMDAEMDGFATGLSICLTRDGQAAMEAPLNMGNFKLINLADPSADQDAVTKKFLETNFAAYLQVGPTPPTTPKMGSLWYRDVSPVGLFMYYADPDSSQWIQLAGSGLPPNFATQAEAREGTVTDKVMSPALVKALSGILVLNLVGPNPEFTDIPPEATTFDLTINGDTDAGSQGCRVRPNAINTGYTSSSINTNAITTPIVDNTAFGWITTVTAAFPALIQARLTRIGGSVFCNGNQRQTTGHFIMQQGVLAMLGIPMTSLRITAAGGNWLSGTARLAWRI